MRIATSSLFACGLATLGAACTDDGVGSDCPYLDHVIKEEDHHEHERDADHTHAGSCPDHAPLGWITAPRLTDSLDKSFKSLKLAPVVESHFGGNGGDQRGYFSLEEVETMEQCADKCADNALCAGFNWITSDSWATRYPCQLGTVVDPGGFVNMGGCAFVKDPLGGDLSMHDCVVSSDWDWTPCSSVCGEGKATRTREVVVEARNGGEPCPTLSQTVDCMNRVCDCHKVSCKYQTHTCYDQKAPGFFGLGYDGAPVASAYAQAGNTGLGDGDQHGGKTRDDPHNSASRCAPAESLRVFHDKLENGCPLGDESCAMTGHHCKVSENGRTQLHGKTAIDGGDAQRGDGAAHISTQHPNRAPTHSKLRVGSRITPRHHSCPPLPRGAFACGHRAASFLRRRSRLTPPLLCARDPRLLCVLRACACVCGTLLARRRVLLPLQQHLRTPARLQPEDQRQVRRGDRPAGQQKEPLGVIRLRGTLR